MLISPYNKKLYNQVLPIKFLLADQLSILVFSKLFTNLPPIKTNQLNNNLPRRDILHLYSSIHRLHYTLKEICITGVITGVLAGGRSGGANPEKINELKHTILVDRKDIQSRSYCMYVDSLYILSAGNLVKTGRIFVAICLIQ